MNKVQISPEGDGEMGRERKRERDVHTKNKWFI
jgi:hypothetical protein